MKIAIAGDWHGATLYAQRAIQDAKQAGVDLFIHTGDFGFWPGPGGDYYLAQLTETLDELDLWFVDGNHEWHDELERRPIIPATGRRPITDRISHLPRGHRETFDGHTWLFLGGAASVDRAWREPGRDWWHQEYITDDDTDRCISGGPADVMVCHDSPYSTPTLRKAYVGQYAGASTWPVGDLRRSDDNQRRVEHVLTETGARHLFHGHHHRRYSEQLRGGAWVHGLAHEGFSPSRNVVYVAPDGQLLSAPPKPGH